MISSGWDKEGGHAVRNAVCSCILAGLGAAFAGCGDGELAVDPSRVILSDQEIAAFQAHGVPVHGGLTPPDVTGTYRHDSVAALDVPKSVDLGTHLCAMEESLASDGQTISRKITYTGSGCLGSSEDHGLSISGSNQCFSFYVRHQETSNECTASTIEVTSACMTKDGLADYRTGYSTTAEGTGCAGLVDKGQLIPAGGVVVIGESDGLAARME
jgi:hypothetical protein